MSYEGYIERLCANGHLSNVDCYEDAPNTCVICQAPIAWERNVDETNGVEERNPNTMPSKLKIKTPAEFFDLEGELRKLCESVINEKSIPEEQVQNILKNTKPRLTQHVSYQIPSKGGRRH